MLMRALGLPTAMTLVMVGFVFAVNPGLYGTAGLVGGIVTTGLGAVMGKTLFRLTRTPRVGESEVPSQHGDGENGI
jgi:hypothetical protein